MRELGMFFFFLAVAMVIFSSAVYYAEAGLEDTQVCILQTGMITEIYDHYQVRMLLPRVVSERAVKHQTETTRAVLLCC
jgi:hypothetical protein